MTPLFDAHNHLQDHRLDAIRDEVCEALPQQGLVEAVVAGSDESDWPEVAELARRYSWIKPSFGLHPWYVKQRGVAWKEQLATWVHAFPNAGVGEIGLDRWIKDPDVEAQVECFRWQLELAATLNRPASIHCLRAWGMMEEVLRSSPRPERGFLLHSYGGPLEMVEGFVKLGAYFSLSPYFAHERKRAQLEVFRHVPLDRLLAETDAPDMWPPADCNTRPVQLQDGGDANHPANIDFSYAVLANLRGMGIAELAGQLAENYRRLFG